MLPSHGMGATLPSAAAVHEQGQLPCSHDLDQFSQLLQVVRNEEITLAPMSSQADQWQA